MQQRKYGRVLDTSKLPRYTFYHKLAEPEQNCKVFNCLLTAIGKDVSEQLEVLPFLLVYYHRY